MFQNELTGVGFVLTVIHVDVEFIRLQERTGEELEESEVNYFLLLTWNKNTDAHPGDKAVTNVLWQLLVVNQLLQENTKTTHTQIAMFTDIHCKKVISGLLYSHNVWSVWHHCLTFTTDY